MGDRPIILGDLGFTAAELTRTYRTLMIQSPYAIILHDQHAFCYANPAALRLFGVPEWSHLRGRSFTEYVAEDKREAVATLLSAASPQTGSPLEVKLRNTLDQEFNVEIWATSVTVGGRRIVQVQLRDVTSHNLVETMHRRQQERQIIRNFISHLADKTLNPLTTIEGFLVLLKEGSDEVNIDMLLKEAKSIQHIWKQTIDMAQKTDIATMADEKLFTCQQADGEC